MIRIYGSNEACLKPRKTLQFHSVATGDTNLAKNPTEIYSQRHLHGRELFFTCNLAVNGNICFLDCFHHASNVNSDSR